MSVKIIFYIAVLLISIVGYLYYNQQGNSANTLKVGDSAPDFELPDASGQLVSKSKFSGQWLVLYFYPKDDTPGCTKEACHFRDDMHKLEQLGANVVGVSVDDSKSHTAFAKKYSLPFPLLVDKEGLVAEQYGSLTKLGPVKIAKRYTFLINPAGKIAKTYFNVNASKHSQEIIDDLIAFQRGS